jgi:hypothetical protein
MVLAPMLPILLTAAAAGALQAVDSTPVTRAQPELHTPDAIASAVLPYLACLYASRGLPLLKGSDGSQINYDKNDSDCSAARTRARAEALKMLENKPVPGGANPASFIEDALSQMDAYVASLPVRQTTGQSGRPTVIGLPVTIEDEVQPAYNRYEDCLKDQVAGTPFTVDTILSVFRQAMTICRSVRDSAVTEAENALAKKGWDLPRREKAAETTFTKADESWLAMGGQFRDSFLARMSQPLRPKRANKSQ